MKTTLFYILFTVFALNTFGQSWVDANELYSNKKYNEAVDAYKNLESKYNTSVDYWYNRGNAAYKNKQLSQAIYSYEKALLIEPNFKDATFNLQLAKSQVVDRIEPSPSYSFNEKVEGFFAWFSASFLVLLSIVFLFFATALLLYYRFKSNKSIFRSLGYFLAVLYLITLILSLTREQFVNSKKEAIVASERISIMAEPNAEATSLFILHEGTKLILHPEKSNNNWQEIELSDGRVGWCEKNNLLFL